MDFGLSDDQEQLLRAVDRWIERSWSQHDSSSVEVRRAGWAELQANGWTGLLTPSAMPVLDAALLVERLALGGCSLPMGPGAMIAPFVVACAGLEPASGADQLLVVGSADPPVVAAATARGLELADRIVVVARTTANDHPATWSVAAVPCSDGAIRIALDEGRTVVSHVVATIDESAWRPIDPTAGTRAWSAGAVLSAAELVGLAQRVLDDCVSYAKERIQGGKPIGGHQAIQHRLADMLGDIERARFQIYLAATALSADLAADPTSTRPLPHVHRAKALAARDCLTAIRSGHQVLGAISYSAEHELHHVHKQAVVAADEFGDAEHHWSALEQIAASPNL